MAIQGPGFEAGGRITQLVSLLDLPPTLLDACQIPVPAEMPGHSILPLIRKQPVNWPEEILIQISESQIGRAIRTGRWKYSVSAPENFDRNMSGSDTYKEEALYDLLADPYELSNLIHHAAYLGVKQLLQERLLHQMLRAGEALPHIEVSEINEPAGQRKLNQEAGEQ